MASIDYVACLDKMYQGQGFPPYKWSTFDDSPWARFDKPLNEACLGLVSSAGIYREDQEPFDPWAVNDLSFRKIPADTPFMNLRLAHNYFDHRDALKDLNCVFPVHRLLELEQKGFIGRLAEKTITLGMGRLYKRTALQNETTPRIIAHMRSQGVDAVLLVAAWPLDHQSVGLIARKIEEEGMPTIYLGSCRDMMIRVRAPRSAFIDFPLGHQCGKPDDVDLQTRILKETLHVLKTAKKAGTLVDLEYRWEESFNWESYQSGLKAMLEEENIRAQRWEPKS